MGKIAITVDHSIPNILLVDSLDYNVSQLGKIAYNCLFADKGVTVSRRNDDSIVFKGVLKENLYIVDFMKDKTQLYTYLGLVCLRRIAPGIVPANQNLYKLEKQSG